MAAGMAARERLRESGNQSPHLLRSNLGQLWLSALHDHEEVWSAFSTVFLHPKRSRTRKLHPQDFLQYLKTTSLVLTS